MRAHLDPACLSLTYVLGSQAATWSLGFREEGCVRRTASLSRDFQAAAGLVSADALCYLVLFVGDRPREQFRLGPCHLRSRLVLIARRQEGDGQ